MCNYDYKNNYFKYKRITVEKKKTKIIYFLSTFYRYYNLYDILFNEVLREMKRMRDLSKYWQ